MKSPAKPVMLESILSKSRSGWFFLDVPAAIGKQFETDPKTRRVVCILNNKHTFQCALMPNKGTFVIGVNKAIREKLRLEAGDTVSIRLEIDSSKYGAEMPEELREVLNQDPDGDKLFHALTGGMQRSLIYLIAAAKNIDKRIHLSLVVVEHLKDNGGKVDGNRLYEETKRPIF